MESTKEGVGARPASIDITVTDTKLKCYFNGSSFKHYNSVTNHDKIS